MPHSILLAMADDDRRAELAGELDADGHTVYEAASRNTALTALAQRPIDLVVLAEMECPTAALTLLRDLRDGTVDGASDAIAAITLGGAGQVETLRWYAAGTDHHLPAGTSYLLVRAVVEAAARRAAGPVGRGRLRRVGAIEIDHVAREVRVKGQRVDLTAMEYALLRMLASEPSRVFTKDELLRDVWGFRSPGRTRTLDSHAVRLRRKLGAHGERVVANVWGIGYRLTL